MKKWHNDSELQRLISPPNLIKRAMEDWESKEDIEKIRKSKKYKHIFIQKNIPCKSWLIPFNEMTTFQKNLIIKAEIIRMYDALSNSDKSRLIPIYNIKVFATKWHKLKYSDKIRILNYYGIE